MIIIQPQSPYMIVYSLRCIPFGSLITVEVAKEKIIEKIELAARISFRPNTGKIIGN
jgi:hypothetical protein